MSANYQDNNADSLTKKAADANHTSCAQRIRLRAQFKGVLEPVCGVDAALYVSRH